MRKTDGCWGRSLIISETLLLGRKVSLIKKLALQGIEQRVRLDHEAQSAKPEKEGD